MGLNTRKKPEPIAVKKSATAPMAKVKKPTCGSCRFFWKGTSLSDPRCTLNGRHVDGDDVCSRWAPKQEKKSWRKQQQKPKREFWPVQRVRE